MPHKDPVKRAETRRKHYLANREIFRQRGRENYKNTKEFINDWKTIKRCKECHEDRPWLLDFHHRDPFSKDFEVAAHGGRSHGRLVIEMNKCDVLCANCHRDLHHQERQAGR